MRPKLENPYLVFVFAFEHLYLVFVFAFDNLYLVFVFLLPAGALFVERSHGAGHAVRTRDAQGLRARQLAHGHDGCFFFFFFFPFQFVVLICVNV